VPLEELRHYPRLPDALELTKCDVSENFGRRQLLTFWRCGAII